MLAKINWRDRLCLFNERAARKGTICIKKCTSFTRKLYRPLIIKWQYQERLHMYRWENNISLRDNSLSNKRRMNFVPSSLPFFNHKEWFIYVWYISNDIGVFFTITLDNTVVPWFSCAFLRESRHTIYIFINLIRSMAGSWRSATISLRNIYSMYNWRRARAYTREIYKLSNKLPCLPYTHKSDHGCKTMFKLIIKLCVWTQPEI